MSLTVRDRTQEFLSSVTAFEEYRVSSSSTQSSSSARSKTNNELFAIPGETINKSEQIHGLAKSLIDRICETSDKIVELTSLAEMTSNFRDERRKIQSLMLDIKDDIESLNIDIKALHINVKQTFINGNNSNNNNNNNNNYRQHHIELIKIIRVRYVNLAKTFGKSCEISTYCLQKQKDERDKYGRGYSKKINFRKVPRNRLQRKHDNESNSNEREGLLAGSNNNSNNNIAQSQSQLMQFEESQYNESRVEDAMQVERQLTEIGQMMTKLATMVAEQRETIITINTNIDESGENMEGAISELQKYLATLTGNRWLMIKVFAILIFFALFFALFVA